MSRSADDQLIVHALRQLESKKPPVVAKAVQQLMKLAPADPRIEEVLCRRLNDTCLRVRAIAASALGDLKEARRMPPAAASIGITAVSLSGSTVELKVCPSYNVAGLKELLAQALGTTAANVSVMLGTVLLEDSWLLRDHGVHEGTQVSFVRRSEAGAPPSAASIEPLVRRLGDKSERCKREALRALEQLAPHDQRLVDPLLRCLERELGSGGSFVVAVAAARLLEQLDPGNLEFAHALAQGFWREFHQNAHFFLEQRDPLHRLEPLSTLAGILERVAPGDPQIAGMMRFFTIYRLRLLGGGPRAVAAAEEVVGQIDAEPLIKDSLLKVLRRQTQWNVLVSAVQALANLPLEDLRMVEGLLISEEDPPSRSRVKPAAVASPAAEAAAPEKCAVAVGAAAQPGCDLLAGVAGDLPGVARPGGGSAPSSWEDL